MSSSHEKRVKKLLKARIVKGSGNGIIAKGDVKGAFVLVECKASLGTMPSPDQHLGKIAHEAKVLDRIPSLSTARFERNAVGELVMEDIHYFVPSDEANQTVDLGPAMDPKVPRYWLQMGEKEFVRWATKM